MFRPPWAAFFRRREYPDRASPLLGRAGHASAPSEPPRQSVRAIDPLGMTDEAEHGAGTGDEEAGTVRTWLVERDYDDRGLVSLVYATPDGERALRREVSARMLQRNPTTAARDVPSADLEAVSETDRERYRREAARVRENNAPDEEI